MEASGLDVQSLMSGALSLFVMFGIFVEITPIKINPVSSLLKFIGKNINAEMKADIALLKDTIQTNEIDRIRWEILDFANSCRNGRKHTKEEFDHIIELNQKYHNILDERKEKNGQIDIAYEYIKNLYRKCLENNSFLCANGDDDC